MRPDYLSYDEYGTVTLWPLLLFINNVSSIEEFTLPSVIIPTYASILQISRFNELNVNPVDLDSQAQEPSREEQIVLYTNKIAPVLQDQNSTSDSLIQQPEDPVFYIRRRIDLTLIDIQNQHVDLALVPIIESLSLRILDQNFAPIYDTHYTVKERPDGVQRRMSWSDEDNPDGIGLVDILSEGSVLEVQYVQDEGAPA
jgi:hypothetical protein